MSAQPSGSRYLKLILPALFIAIAVFAFKYLQSSKPVQPLKSAQEKVWRVQVQPIQAETISPEVIIQGVVEAPQLFKAAAPGVAWVDLVNVREGDYVQTGSLLLRLDPSDFKSALTQAKAELADIEAQLIESDIRHKQNQTVLTGERRIWRLIQKSVKRNATLNEQALGSTSALESSQKELMRQQLAINERELSVKTFASKTKQLEAKQQRIQAQIEQASRALERSRVIAPYDGVISLVDVAVGERVNAGAALVSMYSPDQLEVRGLIPERYQSEIMVALNNEQTLTAKSTQTGQKYELIRLAGRALPGGVDGFFRADSENTSIVKLDGVVSLILKRPAQTKLYRIPSAAIYDNTRIYLLREQRLAAVEIDIIGEMQYNGQTMHLARSEQISDGEQLVLTRLPNAISGIKVNPIAPEG